MANKGATRRPNDLAEALRMGLVYPPGRGDPIQCYPDGGLGGVEFIPGEIDLFDVATGKARVTVPFRAKLEFEKPKCPENKGCVISV